MKKTQIRGKAGELSVAMMTHVSCTLRQTRITRAARWRREDPRISPPTTRDAGDRDPQVCFSHLSHTTYLSSANPFSSGRSSGNFCPPPPLTRRLQCSSKFFFYLPLLTYLFVYLLIKAGRLLPRLLLQSLKALVHRTGLHARWIRLIEWRHQRQRRRFCPSGVGVGGGGGGGSSSISISRGEDCGWPGLLAMAARDGMSRGRRSRATQDRRRGLAPDPRLGCGPWAAPWASLSYSARAQLS